MNYIKRIRYAIYLNIINKVLKGYHFFEIKRKLLNAIGIKVGAGTNIIGPINVNYCCNVIIGEKNHIGKNFVVNGNGNLRIGSNCDIAPDVIIGTGSHYIGEENRRGGKGKECYIEIGNGVWICTRVTIVEDVKINDGVVIGACALVNKDINGNMLAAGVPAREIKKL